MPDRGPCRPDARKGLPGRPSSPAMEEQAQLLLIAGVVVALLLTCAYAFLASLGESVPVAGDPGGGRGFEAANALDAAAQLAAWNSGRQNASLSWDARANLAAALWAAYTAGFDEENALLLPRGLSLWAQPNATRAGLEAGRFRSANPGVECEAWGGLVLYNATLYTGGGSPYYACAVHATCLDIHVHGDGVHLWRSEVITAA